MPKFVTAEFEYIVGRRASRATLLTLNGHKPTPSPLSLQLEYDKNHEVRFRSEYSAGEEVLLFEGQNVTIDFVYLNVLLDIPCKRFAQLILGEHNEREIYSSPKLEDAVCENGFANTTQATS